MPAMNGDGTLRYAAAACQVDFPNPADRSGIKPHTDRMLTMIANAVEGYAPFLPVKLVVFPEFAHAAPVYPTADDGRSRGGGSGPDAPRHANPGE